MKLKRRTTEESRNRKERVSAAGDVGSLAELLRRPMMLPMTKPDWKNALGLLTHLDRCHRAALDVPGIGSALFHTDAAGMHCADPAFRFVSNLLFAARKRCEGEVSKDGRPGREE